VSEIHLPLTGYERLSEDEMRARAQLVLETLKTRRTIRDFADTPVHEAKNSYRGRSGRG